MTVVVRWGYLSVHDGASRFGWLFCSREVEAGAELRNEISQGGIYRFQRLLCVMLQPL